MMKPQPSVTPITSGIFKRATVFRRQSPILRSYHQRNLQSTNSLRLHLPTLHKPKLKPNFHEHLHINAINTRSTFFLNLRSLIRSQNYLILPLQRGSNHRRVLLPLKKRLDCDVTEPYVVVESTRLDVVVVYSHALVRVSDREIQREIVVERVVAGGGGVGGEIELSESGVADVELDEIWPYDEIEKHGYYHEKDEKCGEDLADEAEDAVENAAATAAEDSAAAAAVGASAVAAVAAFGLRRRDRRAIIGAVELGHWF
ncbi:hypothetical protein PIB30_089159 [Stylosanthes scabra]|uniref:Uncharacterized protein n=1 Tax=Stylosanthes scabra TaxID=79078 RepID=A0ABU6ZSP5_9FABA|nr:hypothetical protein [Stylosanthes scabra]